MASVEAGRVDAVQLSHAEREVRVRCLDQQMEVVAHQAVAVADPAVPLHHLVEPGEQRPPVNERRGKSRRAHSRARARDRGHVRTRREAAVPRRDCAVRRGSRQDGWPSHGQRRHVETQGIKTRPRLQRNGADSTVSRPFQSVAEFEAAVGVLPTDAAEHLGATFLNRRLDGQYTEQAAEELRLRHFSDGLAYTGYLWDFLAEKRVVSEEEVWRDLELMSEVYAMWDIHSEERVRTPVYLSLPKAAVLRTDPATLRRGIEYLPEDLYIFDATCAWAAALTHEWVDDRRFCLWSGDGAGSATADA